MEGFSYQTCWKWFETIGPLKERWGRPGLGVRLPNAFPNNSLTLFEAYYNSGGLGLLEYLNWAESMEMEDVMAVWSGYALVDSEENLAGGYPRTNLRCTQCYKKLSIKSSFV